MATVHTSVESARGCGYRKGGDIYLVSGGLSEPCPKLRKETPVVDASGFDSVDYLPADLETEMLVTNVVTQ